MFGKLDRAIDAALLPEPPERLAVAVSGGGDSMALLVLLKRFSARRGTSLFAVTVDHGLRPEAAEEAQLVSNICARFEIPHQTLKWSNWDGRGNLQDQARRARYELMADWASTQNIKTVALAHTLNDQAETVLMRLGRAAGVDGLSAMADRQMRHGICWIRPLIAIRRSTLRDVLRAEDINWAEDPSNEDTRFDRIKARQALETLTPLGITAETLAQTAQNMFLAREALETTTTRVLQAQAQQIAGAIVVDRAALEVEPEEIQRRVFLACLRWITDSDYAPRSRALASARWALAEEGAATLDGCHLRIESGRVWVFREFERVRRQRTAVGTTWDGRWHVTGPTKAVEVAALGPQGLAQCADWRDTYVPRAALLATPAVWQSEELIAAPVVQALLERDCAWRATLKKRADALFDAGQTH